MLELPTRAAKADAVAAAAEFWILAHFKDYVEATAPHDQFALI